MFVAAVLLLISSGFDAFLPPGPGVLALACAQVLLALLLGGMALEEELRFRDPRVGDAWRSKAGRTLYVTDRFKEGVAVSRPDMLDDELMTLDRFQATLRRKGARLWRSA